MKEKIIKVLKVAPHSKPEKVVLNNTLEACKKPSQRERTVLDSSRSYPSQIPQVYFVMRKAS